MKKADIPEGERVFCDGVYLVKTKDGFVYDGYEGTIYCDGEAVEDDE